MRKYFLVPLDYKVSKLMEHRGHHMDQLWQQASRANAISYLCGSVGFSRTCTARFNVCGVECKRIGLETEICNWHPWTDHYTFKARISSDSA